MSQNNIMHISRVEKLSNRGWKVNKRSLCLTESTVCYFSKPLTKTEQDEAMAKGI
jgi:hypothetical protein